MFKLIMLAADNLHNHGVGSIHPLITHSFGIIFWYINGCRFAFLLYVEMLRKKIKRLI